MVHSSRPQWLQNAVTYLLDNIFDILTIGAAAYVVIRQQVKPYTAADIAELATWVTALLGLIAVSGLWQQHRRLKAIETLGRDTYEMVAHKLVAAPRAQEFFWPPGKSVTPEDLRQADEIYIVGMVLARTVRSCMAVLGERLAAGANLKLVLLDWENDELMAIVPNRSIGSHDKAWWRERIKQSQEHIEDIPTTDTVKGTLQIGFLPYFPCFGMYLIDPDQPYGRIEVEIYHHQTAEMNATFSLRAAEDAYWYGFFRKQFDVLWKSCEEKGRVMAIVPPASQ